MVKKPIKKGENKMRTKTKTKVKNPKPSIKGRAKKKENSAEFTGEIKQDEKQKYWLKGGITPVGLVLYPNVFTTKLSYNGNMKKNSGKNTDEEDREYSCTLLFKKNDPVLKSMEKKIIELFKMEFPIKDLGSNTINDGDEKYHEDPESNEIYKGTKYMVLKRPATLDPIVIFDMKGNEMMGAKEFYSGCYARATVTFKTYDIKKKKGTNRGVSCYWAAIKKVADGERLGFDQVKNAQKDFAKGSGSVKVDKNGNVSY